MCSGDTLECQGSNSGRLYARQAFYSLYFYTISLTPRISYFHSSLKAAVKPSGAQTVPHSLVHQTCSRPFENWFCAQWVTRNSLGNWGLSLCLGVTRDSPTATTLNLIYHFPFSPGTRLDYCQLLPTWDHTVYRSEVCEFTVKDHLGTSLALVSISQGEALWIFSSSLASSFCSEFCTLPACQFFNKQRKPELSEQVPL